MSGPGFAFKWGAVNPDVDWQLTQSKSYGDGIQTLNNAMNAFADSTRKQNTDALLMQIAQANDPTALGNTGILASIDPLNRTVAGADVLKDFMSRDDALRTKQANTMATDFLLNNTTDVDLIKERSELEGIKPEYMGPIANLVTQQRATAAAAAQQAAENNRKDIEVGLKVAKNNSDIELNNFNMQKGLYDNQGKEETVIMYDENGKAYPVTTRTPSLAQVAGAIPPEVRAAVHAGESNGDYDTLYGNSHKGKGKFAGVKLTNMTVNEALEFSKAGGDYAEWSKSQKGVKPGTYATPMGAWQIVGSTLKNAAKALKLSGNEKMTPELQDRIADYIYQTQGTDAWEGYKGPKKGGGGYNPGAIDAAVNGNTSGEVDNPFSPGSVAVPSSSTAKGAKGQAPKFQPGVGFDGPSVLEAQTSMKSFIEAANAKNTIAKAKPSKVQETEFQQFLAKGGYTGSEILNRNAELYGTLKNFGEFNKMPGSEKKALLEFLTNENQKGVWLSGRLSAAEVKAKVERYKADRKFDAAATAKQEAFTALNAAATKLYHANVKRFPNITMQQAREMVDKKLAADYAKVSKGG